MNDNDASRLDRLWSPEPEPTLVERGPWAFELRGDEIADLTFDGSAIVRSVRAVARDQDWNTVPATVDSAELTPDGIRLQLTLRGFGADISATVDVARTADSLTVELTATPHSDFRTNRIGLVVLHPPLVAGQALTVGTADGENPTTFPTSVSPHQPAFDIRSLSWELDGVHTRAEFSGDVFEMEDQRNWTDASFKTYSRPLALPFPYTVTAGETVRQSISFSSRRERARELPGSATSVTLIRTGRPVPELSLGASTTRDDTMTREYGLPLPDGLGAVVVELDTRTNNWRAALQRAIGEAGGLGLDVRIVADNPDAVAEAVAAVADSGAPVARLGVFAGTTHVSESALWGALAESARRLLPNVSLVGGARSHFTELNREHHRLPGSIPELTFSVTPQMHARERAQLVESIPMQTVVVRSAGEIAQGRPLHVGPITLRPRFNAVATSDDGNTNASDLTGGYGAELVDGATDPRQSSDALEAWTVASFAAIAEATDTANVASVTYFEISGPRGLSDRGETFPVARAISALAALAGGELLVPSGARPADLWSIGSRQPDGSWLIVLANLGTTPVSTDVTIDDARHSVELAPYEVLTLSSAVDTAERTPDTTQLTEGIGNT
jgi:hypothetical protein